MLYFSDMKKVSTFLSTFEGKFIVGLGIIIIALFAYYFYALASGDVKNVTEVTISETDHVKGAQGAKVTLVEFGDFQCPACGAYEPIIRNVIKANPDTLQFVFRHFPLTQIHPNALLASKAAEAASLQGKFWEMHDIIYDKQAEWSGALNARDLFVTYATSIGLDTAKFSSDINLPQLEEKIRAEYKEGVQLGVQGTPTFFVNGKKIENPKSLEDFNKIIQEAAK